MNEVSNKIDERLPVWRAFSELFLDTELDEKDYEYIAKVCSESPYSDRELESILFNEVWPTLRLNLYSITGNWSGWSDEFLSKNIVSRDGVKFCIPWWLNPAKRYFLKDAWYNILGKLNGQRF